MAAPYCLPIIKQSPDEILEIIQANLSDYHYFEIWLDYIGQLDNAAIQQAAEFLGERLIIVFRRQDLESITMPLARRQEILNMLSNSSVGVDLDVTTQQDELEYIHQQNLTLNLTLSYHDYQQTPDDVRLAEIIDTMKPYQPAVYKLSTFCETPEDSLRLLQVLRELKSQGLAVIILGMGEHGLATRIFGSAWGNVMTFAPVTSEEKSAPGQLTREQLEIIFKELES